MLETSYARNPVCFKLMGPGPMGPGPWALGPGPRARAQGPGGGARGGPSGGEAAELKGSPGRHGKCVVFVLKISPSDRDGVEFSFNVLWLSEGKRLKDNLPP